MEESEFTIKTTSQYFNALKHSARIIEKRLGRADIAVVLGSGLHSLVETLEEPVKIEYSEIPHMPMVSVSWHGKALYSGIISNKKVLLWSGRVHMYEGYNNNQVSFISHISALLGCRFIILTNSVGGGIIGMKPGSIMISRDHINFTTEQPITSCWTDSRFKASHFNGSLSHSKYLNSLAKKIAEEKHYDLFEGVYTWCLGPCFETPMETTTLRAFGGGCFGMSTVPEILASGQSGMECAVVSLVCNLAAGMQEKVTDTEVFDVAINNGPIVGEFIKQIISEIDLSTIVDIKINTYEDFTHDISSFLLSITNEESLENYEKQIKIAFDILRYSFIDIDIPQHCVWFCSRECSAGLINNENIKHSIRIPLTDLTNPHLSCMNCKGSEIVYVETIFDSNIIIVVTNSTNYDIDPSISKFLMRILKEMKINSIKFILEAAKTGYNSNLNDGDLVPVADYMSRSYSKINCESELLCEYLEQNLILHQECINTFQSFNSNSVESDYINKEINGICLISQLGPAYPTNANINLYSQTGQDLVTITSLDPINQACSLNIAYCILAKVLNSEFNNCEYRDFNSASNLIYRSFSDITINTFSYTQSLFKNIINSIPSQILIKIPMENSVDDFDETVDLIKSHIDITDICDYGVILLPGISIYDIFDENSALNEEIQFDESIILTNNLDQQVGELHKVRLFKKKIIILEETNELYSYINNKCPKDTTSKTIPTRILSQLGVKNFIMIGNVTALDPDYKIGDVVLPTDQINLSCRNPTIGRNIDTWGMRFYDCSKIYSKDNKQLCINKIEGILNNIGVERVHQTGILYLNGSKPYIGLSEQRFGKSIDQNVEGFTAKCASFYGYYESMAIRHIDIKSDLHCVFIGFINDNVNRFEFNKEEYIQALGKIHEAISICIEDE